MKRSGQCKSKGRGRGRPRKILKTEPETENVSDDASAPSSLKKNVVGQSNARVTRSKAATVQNQNQLVRAISAKCTKKTPDSALKPVSIAASKGVASNPPKLTGAIRCIEKNGASSPDTNKQPSDECVGENIPHGNQVAQGSCPSSDESRNTNPSNARSGKSLEKKDFDEFERCFLRPTGEDDDDDGLEPRLLTLPSSSTQHVESVLPCAIEKTGLRTAHSFNLTEMAAMMDDHSLLDDDDQAESSIDPALTNVEGYLVRKEVAPMLERIFKKYNDIARESIIKNRRMAVPILEMVCSYCHKLESTGLNDIMESEIEDMTLFVKYFQQIGFDVKWLIERFEDVSETKRLMKSYPTLKDGKLKIEMKGKEMDVLKQKLSTMKAEFGTMKAELAMMKDEEEKKYRDFDERMNALKLKGLRSWDNSLLYGLL